VRREKDAKGILVSAKNSQGDIRGEGKSRCTASKKDQRRP